MSIFFMFLLFVLNIFTIFAIIVLYLRQNRLSKVEKDQKAMVVEMEQLMSGFLMEMKQDNETLVKAFTHSGSMNSEHDRKRKEHGAIRETMEGKEVKQEQNMLKEYKEGSSAATKKQVINAYKIMPGDDEDNALPVIVEDKLELSSAATTLPNEGKPTGKEFKDMLQTSVNEHSLNEQVDRLADQGHSIEEIAKRLGRGQTEIELLLKFRKNR
ncbi:DUF6115 domain-containing protein [Peribacillus simplex]|uniref:DUF6115 domain-containing protein n=1 Tax=Peribacillus simplex TaxID=1478 RepID=UPI003D2D4989